MARIDRMVMVFILVLFLSSLVFSKEKQAETVEKLRAEILAAYQAKGEKGLRNFFRKNKNLITNEFIMAFAEAGMFGIKEDWLTVCKILATEQKDEKTYAVVLFRAGEFYSTISDYKNAFDHFDKAFPIFQRLKHSVGQGNVYLCKGDIYAQIGENEKAFEVYNKALPFFKKTNNSFGLGNVYIGKGKIFSLIGENSKALKNFDKALSHFEKAGYTNGQGNAFMQKGASYYYSGNNSKALEMYDKALSLYEQTGFAIGLGNVYLRKGVIFFDYGENLKALGMFDTALPFFDRAADAIGQGNVCLCKGDVYLTIGENSKAHNMYITALPFFDKASDTIGEGNIYMRIGDIYFSTGDNLNAIIMYDKSLSFYEESGDIVGQGNVYKSKGNIFVRIGDNSKALELFNKALLFFQKSENLVGQGNVYLSKGDIFFQAGNNSKALEMYNKSLFFFDKNKDLIGQGNAYISKGYMLFKDGEYLNAIDMFNKALLFYEKKGEPFGKGNVCYRKGEIYLKTGENSKAVEIFEKASFYFDKAGDIELESYALHGKAKGLAKIREKDKALAHFEKGIILLEKMRTQTAFSEMKRNFLEKVSDQYVETVLFMLEKKYHDKAFKYGESMKARVFLDQMTEGLERPDKGLNPELKEKRDALVGKLSALSRQMQETPGIEEKKLQELKEQYRQVASEFDDLLIKIRLDNPLYASINYPQPISVNDLQTDVLKKGETLLSYFISKEKTFVFIVSKEKFRVKQLKVTESEINGLVNRHLQAINENNSRDISKYGTLLHEKLFKPLEKYLKKSRDIIIVPSGELETIPFESLVTGKNKSGFPVFLLEKYCVKYLQSASLLSILRQHYKRDTGTQSFIGFGDPVYETTAGAAKEGSHKETQSNTKEKKTSSEPSVSSVAIESSPGENGTRDTGTEHEILDIHRDRFARAGGSLPRLPNSGEEINTIARLFRQKRQKTRVFLRDQANEANAKSPELKDFDYIHFSCHGLLNDDFQCLVLSRDAERKEDGYLTLNEIMNCGFNARLVVLSACMTGSGKKYKGEGVTGLTRAVMYAGSPAVIASLWKVDDFATKELMVNFYKNLLDKNLDKSEALRLAKLELLKTEEYRSPYYWSAFVMYGE